MAIDSAIQLAIQRQQSGDLQSAEQLYGQVLLVDPHNAVCLHNLGAIRMQRGDLQAALELLQAATVENPHEALFSYSLGIARQAAGDHAGAASAYRNAVRLQPRHLQAWQNLGVALQRQGLHEEAIESHRHALEIDPSSRAVRNNLGNTLREAGRWSEAEALDDDSLQRNPLDADAAVQRGIARLARGDFSGWQDYAWGHWSPEWLKLDLPMLVPLPQWDGTDCAGKGLLLYGEQGIGDEIMFSALVPAAVSRSGRAALLCEARLVPLFARSFPGIRVAPKPAAGEPPLLDGGTDCRWRCSLPRLPGLLCTDESMLPGQAWLRADQAQTQAWRQRLAGLGGNLRVGISWRGGAIERTRSMRSVALDALLPLFALSDCRFVDVQHGPHDEEVARFNAMAPQPLHGFRDIDPLKDMDGFAALLSALDLVISVDNSTVHLAGALGTPAWMLCPQNANWRWGRERTDSPWYDSMRLFRQQRPDADGWHAVIQQIAATLSDHARPPPRDDSRAAAAPTAMPATIGTSATPSALLLGDMTYWAHWGNAASSLALHEGLREAGHSVDAVPAAAIGGLHPLPAGEEDLESTALRERFFARNAPLLERMQRVHEVVINGSAMGAGAGQDAHALLYLAWIARRVLGKRTSMVHCSLAQAPGGTDPGATSAMYARVLSVMDFISTRDAGSHAALARLGIQATPAFDALALFVDRHAGRTRPGSSGRVLLTGGLPPDAGTVTLMAELAKVAISHGRKVDLLAGAAAFIAPDDVRLAGALHPVLRGSYRLVAATSERQWLDALAGADLLVTGHAEHAIAAALLDTPVAMYARGSGAAMVLPEIPGLGPQDMRLDPTDTPGAVRHLHRLLESPGNRKPDQARRRTLLAMARQNFSGLSRP